ncbi:MAG: glutamate-1-semialdehyde 2,1-aminomutase [Armatimonadota bacterium]|nr:MAG: glutamate-1-semialdehyde 2,1-aminomutase [Armatimonadota bacterium]
MPGGVNSPVRSFAAVGGEPVFFARGAGSRIYDVDGNEYVDCVCSWGPLILGHAHPRVVERVQRVVGDGTSFGACVEAEVELAEMIVGAVPGVEMVRLVSSGTEAVMSAIRLARAFTGRSDIIKFEGCYHGHSDGLLARAGSGVATLGLPDSPGVPEDYAAHTLVAPYNDLKSLRRIAERRGDSIAAVVVEPVAGNMGVVAPADGFLEGLRALTQETGALLIFDEVISGFRLGLGGAQECYGVTPDLTTLGKIIGGGFPVGAYGGRREIMEMVAPSGAMYQAGTLSGNPVAVASGLETLRILTEPGTYDYLDRMGEALADGLERTAQGAGVPACVNRVGSMLTLFFAPESPRDYASAKAADATRYGAFFRAMLDQGVYLPPSQFEALFVSTAHTSEDVEQIAAAARAALSES